MNLLMRSFPNSEAKNAPIVKAENNEQISITETYSKHFVPNNLSLSFVVSAITVSQTEAFSQR